MSSAVEERRKIEEEIKERKQKLAELDKQENKTKHNSGYGFEKYLTFCVAGNIILAVMFVCFLFINTSKTVFIISMIFLADVVLALIVDGIAIKNYKPKSLSNGKIAFLILLNLPATIITSFAWIFPWWW